MSILKIPFVRLERLNIDSYLKKHSVAVQKHKCEFCEKVFKLQKRFNTHMKSHLEGKPTFQCQKCRKSYNSVNKWKPIKKNAHDASKQCEICQKTFAPINFEQHMKIHEDNRERAFKCDLCPKSYLYKCHLKLHMKKIGRAHV